MTRTLMGPVNTLEPWIFTSSKVYSWFIMNITKGNVRNTWKILLNFYGTKKLQEIGLKGDQSKNTTPKIHQNGIIFFNTPSMETLSITISRTLSKSVWCLQMRSSSEF